MSDAFRKGLEAQSASMHEFKDEPSAALVRVCEDVPLESGEVLKAGTVCKVFAETEDAFGIEWAESPPSVVLHSMAIARHKVEVVL